MPSPRSADVAVVGAGIVGLCTAWALAERGVGVRVYEAAAPGAGQSGGEGRIFRHAHEDPRLVALARESRAAWRELEARLGTELVSGDGAVAIGAAVERRLAGLEAAGGLRARRIAPAELAERLPVLAGYEGPAMLDEDGGSIRTRAAIAALAGARGDGVVADEVYAVRETPAGTVEVRTGGARAEHAAAIVCAGRGTARLARGAGLELPVALAAHVRLRFGVRGAPPARLACLQDSSGVWVDGSAYASGAPGNATYAVGIAENVPVSEDGAVDPAALASLAERTFAYVRRALPGLDPTPLEPRHCWVTSLPWGDDGVAAWTSGPVVHVAGKNLFKLAPALGRALARAATGGGVPESLRPAARLGRADASRLAPGPAG
jgi:sarcosine oxidase